MTVPEAAQLVLNAASMGEGGEIFVLDMGEPVRILDVAKDVITLAGLRPFEDVDIVFTGMRPGEKLFEEIEINGENIAKTRHPKIYIGNYAGPSGEEAAHSLERLRDTAAAGSSEAVVAALCELVPEAELHRQAFPRREHEPATLAVAAGGR
jgi:FlaA1/EpsC-like NDP-sugar epimerase